MTKQFITNGKGEKTAVILSINEYEDLIHQHHLKLELSDEYKIMIDKMIEDEANGDVEYLSYETIKERFLKK